MNWLSRRTKSRETATTITVSGKRIDILCSAEAAEALAGRDRPLIVEIRLALACVARKQVRFHDDPPPGRTIIAIDDKTALIVTTIIPERGGEGETAAKTQFLPKWVRLHYADGTWVGDYGL